MEHVDNFPYENPDGYESYSYEQAVGDPIRLVIEQHLTGQPITWTGPDRIHFSIAATCPPPSSYLSKEGLEFAEEDQGQDFWDAVIQVAFMLGWHQGTMREQTHSAQWKELYEHQRLDYLRLRAEHPLPEPTELRRSDKRLGHSPPLGGIRTLVTPWLIRTRRQRV